MTKSSRHKSHKRSKHSSKDYTDSEEDVKIKRRSKDENLTQVLKESASGEKRKISSQVKKGKDGKDLSGHVNGGVSKWRKEKADAADSGDRWIGSVEERGESDRNAETLKTDSITKEVKDDNLRTESKKKSRRHESGRAGEKKDENMASVVLDKEESKSKGESKKKPERDSSARKEVKEPKDKDRRSENKKNGDQEIKLVDMDIGKKQVSVDFTDDRQGKRTTDSTAEHVVHDESRNPVSEKENEKKTRSRKEGFSEPDKQLEDSKQGKVRELSSADRAKDVPRGDKQKRGSYTDKYPENRQKDDRQRNEKYLEESDKADKHRDVKCRELGEKDARHKDDGDRIFKSKEEKHGEDVDQKHRRKNEKYREGNEREHKDDKYLEDGNTDKRRKGDRNCEDGGRDYRREDKYHEDGDRGERRHEDKYLENGDRDEMRRDSSYKKDGERVSRQKDEKNREDVDEDTLHKDRKLVDYVDRDKRTRDSKSMDDHAFGVGSTECSDRKRLRDDIYLADHHSKKSSAHGESPTRDDRTMSYQDDHGKRRITERENYSDLRSQSTKDHQRLHEERRDVNSGRKGPLVDKGRSTSKNADIEYISSHSRRQNSPTINSHAARDHYRTPKQDDSKYRDYSYDERARRNINSTRDYPNSVGGVDHMSSSRSLEKLDQKVDFHLKRRSAERHLESDIRSSYLHDKSPFSNTDRRQFSSNAMQSTDTDKSLQRSGGSRDLIDYSSKDDRASREGILDGDEFPQGDSSASMRNNSFPSGSKSIPPSRYSSPVPFGIGEGDIRGMSNSRNRRNDPNLGRVQGNNWRGGWPSPGPNGFLPIHHAPPPLNFHSPMHPFHMPNPMFPYAMLNPRFPGPGHPMGWRNPMDGPIPPFNTLVPNNGVFGDDYGRLDLDHMSSGHGWGTNGDMSNGQNRSASGEIPSSEKGNNFAQSQDEASRENLLTLTDNQAETIDFNQSTTVTEKNDIEAPCITLEETNGIANVSTKEDVRHSYIYFSKLDISTDLCEPELFDECKGLMVVDPSPSPARVDSKVLYVEEAVKVMESLPNILSCALFPPANESVFQKAMSLYKRTNRNSRDNFGEELQIIPELIPNTDPMNHTVQQSKTEKVHVKLDMEVNSPTVETSEQKIIATEIKEEPISAVENVPMGMECVEELKLVDVKCVVPLVNSEVEEMVRESVLVNLSRIHHSSESTH